MTYLSKFFLELFALSDILTLDFLADYEVISSRLVASISLSVKEESFEKSSLEDPDYSEWQLLLRDGDELSEESELHYFSKFFSLAYKSPNAIF